MSEISSPLRTVRSFVIREGRFTDSQKRAFKNYWPQFGISLGQEQIGFSQFFSRRQPIVFDIGFGNGDSLLSIAQQRPDLNFVGIEVYRPGIGHCFQHLVEYNISNVRVINADVIDVLKTNVATGSLHGILVWFPDPWPKKRHHKRRLINQQFITEAVRALHSKGVLHLATDWQPYAQAMEFQVNQCYALQKMEPGFNPLQLQRSETRFEKRGLRLGHRCSDLIYQRQ